MNSQTAPAPQLFAPDIVEFGPPPSRTPYLVGGHCAACEATYFPWAPACRHCEGALTRVSLGSRGTIHSATLVRTKPPLGLPRPYGVAYVDLDAAPVRVFMLADAAHGQPPRIGAKVALAVAELGVDAGGQRCLRPIFRTITD